MTVFSAFAQKFNDRVRKNLALVFFWSEGSSQNWDRVINIL